MHVYITKYALTRGIFKAKVLGQSKRGAIQVADPRGLNGWALYFGNEWHTSATHARTRAAVMRNNKIVSLKKQIRALEALDFTIEETS